LPSCSSAQSLSRRFLCRAIPLRPSPTPSILSWPLRDRTPGLRWRMPSAQNPPKPRQIPILPTPQPAPRLVFGGCAAHPATRWPSRRRPSWRTLSAVGASVPIAPIPAPAERRFRSPSPGAFHAVPGSPRATALVESRQ
jgi:hypothetical protein